MTGALLHVQVKLLELDNCPDAWHVEHEAGEVTKQQKWPSTAVKAGAFRLPFLCCHCLLATQKERRAAGISWKGVLVIHIIMGRGRPKGVKDSRPRTVNTTQKSKHNKGGNGGTATPNGERSTTALTFNEQRERGMLPHAVVLHQENVMSNEQLNRQRVEAGQIAPIFSVSPLSTLACAFVITPLRIFAYLSFSL